jgi:F-type H+-transporting ATPase subunit c
MNEVTEVVQGITNEGFVLGMSALAAGIAMIAAALSGLGQGNATGKAVEAVGRQPEAKGDIQQVMIIGLAMTETSGIYGLIVAMVLLFANPLIGHLIG